MNPLSISKRILITVVPVLLWLGTVHDAGATLQQKTLPDETKTALQYLLDLAKDPATGRIETDRIAPFITFLMSAKPSDTLFTAGDGFGAPSAYNAFTVNTDLWRIASYAMNTDIPACTLWPSSLRTTRWTRVDGGDQQLQRLIDAANGSSEPFVVRGEERVTITPDQHSGAYYSYDVDKAVFLSPFEKGKLLISVYMQQGQSEVGKKGVVLGNDDNWSYLYSNETGLNLTGLGWVDSYMYDSFSVCVYYQPDPRKPVVTYGSVSWVNAGWSGINMVKPIHIYKGLLRVADAFTAVIEDPNLPDPATLAQTFSRSKHLPTPTLKQYAGDYFAGLEKRIAASDTLRKKVNKHFDSREMIEQMTRDELYAILALDYLKKILGKDAVLDSHPF